MTPNSSIDPAPKKDPVEKIAVRDGQNSGNACLVVTRRMLLVKPSVLTYNARMLACIFIPAGSTQSPHPGDT